MFTGIIEETGTVKTFTKKSTGAVLTISCQKVLENTKSGDSISINGVCQTVVNQTPDTFSADVSPQTLEVTNLCNLKAGDSVNLERALTLSSRLGGHIVTGHTDCRGKLLSIQNLEEFHNLTFEVPENLSKYVAERGSVAVDGVSLTVAQTTGNTFMTAIIPATYNNTTLKYLKAGDCVNIETDILAKYVEKISCVKDNSKGINVEFLAENGFV